MQAKHKVGTSLYPNWPVQDEFHWFLSSQLNWVSDTDLFRGLRRIHKADREGSLKCKGCRVYKVLGRWDSNYEINNYRPDTEGVEFITQILYKPEKLK
tara:strand:+ start:3360 stop:3653 length:294 start_codon:yes stop_codon:yes gene_type:complete